MDDFTSRIMERARNRANLCQSSVAAVESLSSRQQQQQRPAVSNNNTNHLSSPVKKLADAPAVDSILPTSGKENNPSAKSSSSASSADACADRLHSNTRLNLAKLSSRYRDADGADISDDNDDETPRFAASTDAASNNASDNPSRVSRSLRNRLASLGNRLQQMENDDCYDYISSKKQKISAADATGGERDVCDAGVAQSGARLPTRHWPVRSASPLRKVIGAGDRQSAATENSGDKRQESRGCQYVVCGSPRKNASVDQSADEDLKRALEAKGFTTSSSGSKLVYDFTEKGADQTTSSSHDTKSVDKTGAAATNSVNSKQDGRQQSHKPYRSPSPVRHVWAASTGQTSPVRQLSPVRQASPMRQPPIDRQPSPVRHASPVRQPPLECQPVLERHVSPVRQARSERQSSPVRHASPVRGRLIQQRAALFDKPSSRTDVDPTQLSLAERRKLFESGEPPKVLARFGAAVTPAMLQKHQSQTAAENIAKAALDRKKETSTAPVPVTAPAGGDSVVSAGRRLWEMRSDRQTEDESVATVTRADESESASEDSCDEEISMEPNVSRPNITPISLPGIGPANTADLVSASAPHSTTASADDNNNVTSVSSLAPPISVSTAPGAGVPAHFSDYQVRIKPGCLYPYLSDLETPQSSLAPESSLSSCENSDCSLSGQESLGTRIQQVAQSSKASAPRLHSISEAACDDDSTMECAATHLTERLRSDEGLAECEFPEESPAKRAKTDESPVGFRTPLVSGIRSPKHNPVPATLIDNEAEMPLMHSVSFYRKQKPQEVTVTPVKRLAPQPVKYQAPGVSDAAEPGSNPGGRQQQQQQQRQSGLQELIRCLNAEVEKQQQVMSQASRALFVFEDRQQHLPSSSSSSSATPAINSQLSAMVEAERVLLVATHRKQAAVSELQRLRAEGAMQRSGIDGATAARIDGVPVVHGSLSVDLLCLPLKSSFVRQVAAGDADLVYHFICLLRYRGQVTATELLATSDSIKGGAINFPNLVTFGGLEPDFSVAVEVYALTTTNDTARHSTLSDKRSRKDVRAKTPKKCSRQRSAGLGNGTVSTPSDPSSSSSAATPSSSAVAPGRGSSFQLFGFVHVTARSVTSQRAPPASATSTVSSAADTVTWSLERVPYDSPLSGSLMARCSLQTDAAAAAAAVSGGSSRIGIGLGPAECSSDALCAFVTVFSDVQGLGAWRRRWCRLAASGGQLLFWKYPECEEKQLPPIDQLKLASCVGQLPTPVQLVAREVCARPNTLLLETVRRRRAGDELESLVLVPQTDGRTTIVRNLLSFDTKAECLLWRDRMNATLAYIRAWYTQPLVTD